MAITVNGAGRSNASSKVASGDVDKTSSWSFSAADGNALLGEGGDDWTNYGKWFLGADSSADPKTKARYHYPFGKGGKVYRSGVIAAKQRAAQQGDDAIEAAASALLSAIDGKSMIRAWSKVIIKALDEAQRTLTGIATTPSTDRMGDVVMPKGAKFALPLPLLWQHDATQPIGEVTDLKVTDKGITATMQIAKVEEAGALRDRLDMAWQSLKAGLVKGLSIGFSPLEMEPIKGTYGYQFNSWDFLELSCVTIPANADASILTIKRIDTALLASSGNQQRARPPGVSGKSNHHHPRGNEMRTLQQAIEQRQTAVDRLKEIAALWKSESRDGDDDENAEVDTLTADVAKLATEIRTLRIDAMNAMTAKEVDGSSNDAAGASRGRSPNIIVRGVGTLKDPEDKFKGQSFTRMAIAQALGKLQNVRGSDVAEHLWGKTHPLLVQVIKANEVAGGGVLSGQWGTQLVQANTLYQGDFIEMLYAATVFDKLPLHEIPANVVVKGQDGSHTGYWVGQGKAIPASAADFTSVTLSPLKVAAISVVTNELLRDSTPAAEALVRDSLINAIAQRIDTTFISALAAVSNVSPAGILHGLSVTPSTGEDITALSNDVAALYAPFIAANNADNLAFVTTPSVAKSISLMRSTLGVPLFPALKATGGELLGDPVYTGQNVPARALVLLKPSDIYEIGDLGITVSLSQDAMIEQNSSPSGVTSGSSGTPVAAANTLTSMFQEESTAFKVVRPINFALRRATAVAYISDAAYGQTTT